MNISVQQCLHGYLNGHQLLGASTDFSPEVKRVLLFQSDLSGPSTQLGFDSYITGYPIANSPYYALAKTWYASEMSRPGCVWTHTLLIEIADLGKIPELSNLEQFFKRPTINIYQDYEDKILISSRELEKNLKSPRSNFYKPIAYKLYAQPTKTIIIESENSTKYESAIFDIWSDQWPRLRRKFSFCTGALSLKILYNDEFNLQIVPTKIGASIKRTSKNTETVEFNEIQFPSWVNILYNSDKNTIRRFLWSLGAEMVGDRENFQKLITLYSRLNDAEIDIYKLNDYLIDIFPAPELGKSFKQSVFGKNGLFKNISEVQALEFLTAEHNLQHLNLNDYNINERLIEALNKNQISATEILRILSNAQPNRVSEDIWNHVSLPVDLIPGLIEKNEDLIEVFLNNNPDLAISPGLWKTSFKTQQIIVRKLAKIYPNEFPNICLEQILTLKSSIIFELENVCGLSIVVKSLDWFNKKDNELLESWKERIFYHHISTLCNWLLKNMYSVKNQILLNIFEDTSPDYVFRLSFDHNGYIKQYAVLKQIPDINISYISSVFLAKGFNNNIYGSEWIVTMVFEDVYNFAKGSMLNNNWRIIPKDMDTFEEEDYNAFETFFKALGFIGPKKKHQVPSWDFCEILVRTATNKYIKNNWSPQSFLDTNRNPEIFSRALTYMLTLKKGREYLNKVKRNIFKSRKITALAYQKQVFSELDI